MDKRWKIIKNKANKGSSNMAIDCTILKSLRENSFPPTIKLCQWKKPTITIRYFQSSKLETNIKKAKKNKIPIIRRMTGGGAVLHNRELTYSFFIPCDHLAIKGHFFKSFDLICNPIILAQKKLGRSAEFQPINDILANGKKISGNAQTRKNNILLPHGTILLDISKYLTGAGNNKLHPIKKTIAK